MKKFIILAIVAVIVVAFALPGALFASPGHQRAAADLKGGVAELVPGHMVQDIGNGHQSLASELKWGVTELVPGHVTP